jgi:hypothetical protein
LLWTLFGLTLQPNSRNAKIRFQYSPSAIGETSAFGTRNEKWKARLFVLWKRPAGDDFVDFAHQADGFVERDDDFLVVINVVGGEFAAFAVLEPFFADLIAADLKFPDFLWHAAETLRVIDIDAPGRRRTTWTLKIRLKRPWADSALSLAWRFGIIYP